MRVIREELQNGAYIKRTIRKVVNDDLEICDSENNESEPFKSNLEKGLRSGRKVVT